VKKKRVILHQFTDTVSYLAKQKLPFGAMMSHPHL